MFGNSYYDIKKPKNYLEFLRPNKAFLVKSLAKISFVGIGSGLDHCLGWTKEGILFCWGKGEKSKLGIKFKKKYDNVW